MEAIEKQRSIESLMQRLQAVDDPAVFEAVNSLLDQSEEKALPTDSPEWQAYLEKRLKQAEESIQNGETYTTEEVRASLRLTAKRLKDQQL